jgi:acyl carrier protein
VVIAREDVPGKKRLVCYLIVRDGSSPTVSELRQFLKQKLPDYLVPSTFIILPQLPVLTNGKLDRRALPVPEGERPDLSVAYQAPRCAVEEELVRIWAEVLGVKQVGIHDNFFELGGDSILSVRIISHATQAGLHLSPLALFQHQTIAELGPLVVEQPALSIMPANWVERSGIVDSFYASDFPQAKISQEELEKFLQKIT